MGRLKVKRIGIMAVAMVVAFLSLGTAYASWTDSVEIDDTEGGDLVVVDYSGSTIDKYLGIGPEPAPDLLVAWTARSPQSLAWKVNGNGKMRDSEVQTSS